MRRDEIELISALVEGRLDDELEARALIASSPEMQEEYDAQKIAFEALATAGSASLREDEKAALRRDLWTELRAQPSPSRVPWYYRWVPITAGLFIVVIVGLVVVGGRGESGNVEAAGSFGNSDTTSTAGATGAIAEQEATVTTMAAAAPLSAGGDAETADADTLAVVAQRLREEPSSRDLGVQPGDGETETEEECLVAAGLEGYGVARTIDQAFIAQATGSDASGLGSTSLIVAIPSGSDLKTAPITFVDSQTCQVVGVDG